MGKHRTKKEKIEIVEYYRENGYKKTNEAFSISRSMASKWSSEHALGTLKGIDSKERRTSTGRPKSYENMTKEELIDQLELKDDINKFLLEIHSKSKK